jgi:hydrogenase maturation protease
MTWLVIGIGNTLRRDDGLGPWLVEHIADWRVPSVTTCAVHQLTPELAVEIAKHDGVLFLDASASEEGPQIVEIELSTGANRVGHALSPGDMLALTDRLGIRRPRAWMVAIPGSDFGFGEGLSADAERSGTEVLADIGKLLRENMLCTKSV